MTKMFYGGPMNGEQTNMMADTVILPERDGYYSSNSGVMLWWARGGHPRQLSHTAVLRNGERQPARMIEELCRDYESMYVIVWPTLRITEGFDRALGLYERRIKVLAVDRREE